VQLRADALPGVSVEGLAALTGGGAWESAGPENWRVEVKEMLAKPVTADLAALGRLLGKAPGSGR